jgi:hypothetical protein
MIYPAKIFNKFGELIRTVSSEAQINKFWGIFETEGSDPIAKKKNAKKVVCALEECGKEVWLVSAKARYCSNRCAVKSHNAKKKEDRATLRANRPPKKCIKCGKEFRPKYSNSQHCNDPCQSEFMRNRALKSDKTKE